MFFKKQNRIDYEKILVNYVDGDFRLEAAGKDAPSNDEIKKFEKKYGIRLPFDFKDFSTSSLAGIYVEIKAEVWPRPKPLEVGPFWSFPYGFMVFGLAANTPELMNLEMQSNIFQREISKNFIPFLKIIGDPDVYCFNRSGLIYRWDHELGDFNRIDMSFVQVLDFELGELKARKLKKLQLNK
jgi:hypothetical protein